MSRVAIAAKNQGDYWGMSSLLYENQPKNIEEAVELANKLGFDVKKFLQDIDSPETISIINNEIYLGQISEIEATPTMIINGERTVGVKPYYKLQEILEKNGAEKQ